MTNPTTTATTPQVGDTLTHNCLICEGNPVTWTIKKWTKTRRVLDQGETEAGTVSGNIWDDQTQTWVRRHVCASCAAAERAAGRYAAEIFDQARRDHRRS